MAESDDRTGKTSRGAPGVLKGGSGATRSRPASGSSVTFNDQIAPLNKLTEKNSSSGSTLSTSYEHKIWNSEDKSIIDGSDSTEKLSCRNSSNSKVNQKVDRPQSRHRKVNSIQTLNSMSRDLNAGYDYQQTISSGYCEHLADPDLSISDYIFSKVRKQFGLLLSKYIDVDKLKRRISNASYKENVFAGALAAFIVIVIFSLLDTGALFKKLCDVIIPVMAIVFAFFAVALKQFGRWSKSSIRILFFSCFIGEFLTSRLLHIYLQNNNKIDSSLYDNTLYAIPTGRLLTQTMHGGYPFSSAVAQTNGAMLTFGVLICVSVTSLWSSLDAWSSVVVIILVSLSRLVSCAMLTAFPIGLRPLIAYSAGIIGVIFAKTMERKLRTSRRLASARHVSNQNLEEFSDVENSEVLIKRRVNGPHDYVSSGYGWMGNGVAGGGCVPRGSFRRVSLPILTERSPLVMSQHNTSGGGGRQFTTLLEAEGMLKDLLADPALPRSPAAPIRAVLEILRPFVEPRFRDHYHLRSHRRAQPPSGEGEGDKNMPPAGGPSVYLSAPALQDCTDDQFGHPHRPLRRSLPQSFYQLTTGQFATATTATGLPYYGEDLPPVEFMRSHSSSFSNSPFLSDMARRAAARTGALAGGSGEGRSAEMRAASVRRVGSSLDDLLKRESVGRGSPGKDFLTGGGSGRNSEERGMARRCGKGDVGPPGRGEGVSNRGGARFDGGDGNGANMSNIERLLSERLNLHYNERIGSEENRGEDRSEEGLAGAEGGFDLEKACTYRDMFEKFIANTINAEYEVSVKSADGHASSEMGMTRSDSDVTSKSEATFGDMFKKWVEDVINAQYEASKQIREGVVRSDVGVARAVTDRFDNNDKPDVGGAKDFDGQPSHKPEEKRQRRKAVVSKGDGSGVVVGGASEGGATGGAVIFNLNTLEAERASSIDIDEEHSTRASSLPADRPSLETEEWRTLGYDDEIQRHELFSIEGFGVWEYAIFSAATLAPQTILSRMMYRIFSEMGFFSVFNIPIKEFMSYFHALEMGYREISYHSRVHAADVVQAVFYMTTQPIAGFVPLPNSNSPTKGSTAEENSNSAADEAMNTEEGVESAAAAVAADTSRPIGGADTYGGCLSANFATIELMALFTAAAMHDYDHPGRTNAFLVSTYSDEALLYNDRSVLENIHASKSWTLLMRNKNNNWLKELDTGMFNTFRYLTVEAILATDLKHHFNLVKEFDVEFVKHSKGDNDITWTEANHRRMVANMLIKMADINGPCKPRDLHLTWTSKICEEFYDQGDDEVRLSIPRSSYMDRNNPQVASLQATFIKVLVLPLATVLFTGNLLPCHYKTIDTATDSCNTEAADKTSAAATADSSDSAAADKVSTSASAMEVAESGASTATISAATAKHVSIRSPARKTNKPAARNLNLSSGAGISEEILPSQTAVSDDAAEESTSSSVENTENEEDAAESGDMITDDPEVCDTTTVVVCPMMEYLRENFRIWEEIVDAETAEKEKQEAERQRLEAEEKEKQEAERLKQEEENKRKEAAENQEPEAENKKEEPELDQATQELKQDEIKQDEIQQDQDLNESIQKQNNEKLQQAQIKQDQIKEVNNEAKDNNFNQSATANNISS